MWKRLPPRIKRSLAAALLAAQALAAAEHHGLVTFGGLPVPGATVTATQGEKKLIAVTDAQGAYMFTDIGEGAWRLHVEMLCFEQVDRDVTVAAGAPAAEWQLKILPLEQLQAAAASAPSVAMPAPPPVAVSIVKPEPPPAKPAKGKAKKGAEPPVTAAAAQNGFQRTDVNANANSSAIANEPSGPVTADQARNASDAFAINGSVNNGAASPFAQSGAFGNNRRGMRSLYQAALGITVDNAVWDAQSFSLTGQNTPKPSYSLLQGVASFGGPIRIPRLFKQNAPNVFFGYQWIRNRNASTQSGLMPDAAQRTGDLSHTLNPLGQPVQIIDPTTGAPFPGNVIPANRIDPLAKSLLNFYPLPNFNAGARYNYQIPLVGGMHQDGMQLNIDKTITRRNQIAGTFAFQRTASDTPDLFGFTDRTSMLGLNTGINWSHRMTQRLYTRFGYRFSRLGTTVTPYFANRLSQYPDLAAGIAGNTHDPLYWGPPHLTFSSGITPLNDGQTSRPHNQTSSITTDDFWNHGPHNVRFGGEFRRQQNNILTQQNARGMFSFTGAAAGSDLAGFLLGVPDTSAIAFGNADKYFRSTAYTAYATDDFRVNSSLTLNAGLRWEYGSPNTELFGRLVNLDVVPGFVAVAPVIGSSPTGALTGKHYPSSLIHPDKQGIQPRIGVAWRPLPASSMVIRAGYGVYYNTSVYGTIAGEMAQQSPLSKSLSVQNTKDHPLTLANGFNASPSITPNTFAIDPHFQVGYAQNWDVSIQRDLPGALVVTALYLGIKGTRAQQEFLPNTFPIGAVATCVTCPTGFAYVTSNGNSTREAGQIQIRRRMHNGIAATLQYTYSKAIDDAALGGKGQTTAVIAQDWLNLAGERGLSNFDQRHLLTLQAQYSTGMGLGGGTLMSGWRGAMFKEWTITTQINAGSGLPQNPIYVAAVQGTGVTGSIRPNYTGASLYDAPAGFALNPAAVAKPAPGQWGNAGRNSIIGPGQFTLDASLGRTFRLGDRLNADLRLDATNALNHVTYQSWNANINNAQFGLPTAANKMRMAKVSVRVRF